MNKPSKENQAEQDRLFETGRRKATELLHRCLTPHGFFATPSKTENYARVWGRDSAVIGLAALLSGEEELIEGCRLSLDTLAANQGPHGEIPSNVDPETGRVSYGGTAGRVDAGLWFLIACAELLHTTGNAADAHRFLEPAERIAHLLGAWEFNNRGLLFIPPTGDWADEYLQSGYVLYDELLYHQALLALARLRRAAGRGDPALAEDKAAHLRLLIEDNYWFNRNNDEMPEHVYHPVLYEKGRKALPEDNGKYWLPFFSPWGYGYRFDAFANSLLPLFGLGTVGQADAVDDFIANEVCAKQQSLVPAFCPVITPRDERWDDLQMTFSHTFKNQPYEYHNGGLWPMVNGFYAASLAKRGKDADAHRILTGIHLANRLPAAGGGPEWSFPEYVNGKTFAPGGVHPMGWSAAGAIIADAYLQGRRLFSTGP